MTITKEEIEALTTNEKQQLLDMLWSSLHIKEEDMVPVMEEEEDEEEILILQERLAEYEKDPSAAITWEKAFEQLKKR